MKQQLFNLGTLCVTVGLAILVGTAEANGMISGDLATLLIGAIFGGGAGVGVGRQIGKSQS